MNNLKAIFNLHGQQMDLIHKSIKRGVKINFQDYSESAVKINGVYKCLECDRTYAREPRVEAGMRCGRCSYGLTCHNGHKI